MEWTPWKSGFKGRWLQPTLLPCKKPGKVEMVWPDIRTSSPKPNNTLKLLSPGDPIPAYCKAICASSVDLWPPYCEHHREGASNMLILCMNVFAAKSVKYRNNTNKY